MPFISATITCATRNIFSPAIEDPGTPEIDLSVTDDGDDGTLLIEDPRMTCIFS